MWNKKRRLKTHYGSTAQSYDERYRDIQEKKFRAIQNELGDAEKLLDVGCGTGIILEKIVDKVDLVFGVDFSNHMLRAANNRLGEDSYLVLADADNLPFQDSSFDLVISITLLQNMPNPKITIYEMARVVDNGGKVIVTVLEKKHSINELREWMSSAGFKFLKGERIPDSEDILYIGRLDK